MPKQTLEQFGQTIKAKHPEYADMADADVASKVLAKYPQYGDMVDVSPRPAGLPAGVSLPGVPNAPAPAMSEEGTLGSLSSTVGNIGTHLKNVVAGPYHAVADAPRTPEEQAVKGATADSSLPARTLGQIGLGAYRTLVQPTVERAKSAAALYRKGDMEGAANAAMDAVPIAGPWARNIQNDAEQKGAIPALAGFATDIFAPKIAGAALGGMNNLAGKGLQAAGTTPEALKVAATRALVTGTPGELLNRSLKPGVGMPDFEQSVEASLPSIAKQNPVGVKGFADAANAAKEQQAQWYNNLTQPLNHFRADATPIANAQMGSIPITDLIENPARTSASSFKAFNIPAGDGGTIRMGAATGGEPAGGIINKTAAKANEFRTQMPLGVIDGVRMDTNAKAQSFFNKAGGDKYAAMSDPETARVVATNDAARNIAYDNYSRLSAAGRTDGGVSVPEIQANQDLFGHLADVAQVAGKRATVAGRANPLSLQESLQLHGNPLTQAYNFGTARLFKNLTDSDAVTNAAIDRFTNPESVVMPPRPTFAGNALYTAGDFLGRPLPNPFLVPGVIGQGDKKR